MKTQIILIFILSIAPALTSAKSMDELLSHFASTTWKSPTEGTFLYRHSSPAKMEKEMKYPLLVFFHGAGGRGEDNKKQLLDASGLENFEKNKIRTKHQSHIFEGQVPHGEKWVNVSWSLLGHKMPKISDSLRMAFEALDTYVGDKKNQVDPNRIYVMGLSMGEYTTWDAIQRRPDFFATAVPICGGGDTSMATKLVNLPIWAWHGDKDSVIKPSRSRDMINAISKPGGSPKYSEIKGRCHNSWVDCWNSDALWKWLYSQSKD